MRNEKMTQSTHLQKVPNPFDSFDLFDPFDPFNFFNV